MSSDDPEDVEDPFDDIEAVSDDEVEDLFTEMEIENVDDEEVWEELTDEDGDGDGGGDGEDGEASDHFEGPDTDEGIGITETEPEDEGTIVEKSRYCQGCEHFSEPPAVACHHDGTEIVEMVDIEHFRVRNCPVVERRQSAASTIAEDE